MSKHTDVAIVGAGPYGLSLAAHLQAAGLEYRIFGRPMASWLQMPEGMLLKSDGFASNLSDPFNKYPLSIFCAERSISYEDNAASVELQTFCDYGLAFKDRFVTGLAESMVVSVNRDGEIFALRLDDGDVVHARRVVVAVGVGCFRHIPAALGGLGAQHVSHSFDYHDLGSYAGRRVAVVGGGSSAVDLAGLLHGRGCDVQLICRRDALKFSGPPAASRRSLWRRVRHPRSGIGPGLRSRFCTDAPDLFRLLPQSLRVEFVRRHLGPASPWRMKERVIGRVPVLYGRELVQATAADGGVTIELRRRDGQRDAIRVDHVIAATGFRTDLRRLDFLNPSLVSHAAAVEQSPILSSSFESSIRGLYFIGPAAAASFGPLMRFAFGARFAARRLTRDLSRRRREVGAIEAQSSTATQS